MFPLRGPGRYPSEEEQERPSQLDKYVVIFMIVWFAVFIGSLLWALH